MGSDGRRIGPGAWRWSVLAVGTLITLASCQSGGALHPSPPTVAPTPSPAVATTPPPAASPTAPPALAVSTPTALPTKPASPSPRPVPAISTPSPPTPDPAAVARGKAIFTSSVGCTICHTISGVSSGDQGPNLSHIATQPYDDLPNSPAFLRRWLKNPAAIKPDTIMPNLDLTDQQINDLVAYLETLR